jgi:hypothetical protein
MKHRLLSLFLLFSIVSFGQIELEHTYNNALITRINLEFSGEKYYEFKSATNELVLYNDDHTWWKTILLPAPAPSMFTSTRVFHVSDAEFNQDSNLEIIYGYYNFDAPYYESKVIAEDGTVLLTIPNALKVTLNKIPGLSNKLITENTANNVVSKVYSVPELILENTYTNGQINRVNLENSGEKYYLLNKTTNEAQLYNTNHTIWKTVSLPKPSEALYSETAIGVISENRINTDSLLEIGYSFYTVAGNIYTYESVIVNENSDVLLTLPATFSAKINTIDGLSDKLIATIVHYDNTIGRYYSSNVYTLPGLALEKEYDSEIIRVKLENSGEKYFSTNPTDSYARTYNADHTPWKSIFLDIPFDMYQGSVHVDIISETKIALDPLLEIGYGYVYYSPLMYTEYYGRVMNENGLTYLNTTGAQSYTLSEFPNLPNKLIELINFPDVFENTSNYQTSVYSIDATMGTSGFQNKKTIEIAPNPANSVVNIASTTQIVEASIFNILGAKVKDIKAQNLTKINVENLSSGMYLLTLLDNNNQKSVHKITISH